MNELVPFGKYKNQPLEVLAQDRSYCEWLVAQGWVRDRFPSLYTVIINNFGEPSETPEHNAMQARFLNDGVCYQCFYALNSIASILKAPKEILHTLTGKRFEHNGIDVLLGFSAWEYSVKEYLHKYEEPVKHGGRGWSQQTYVEYADWGEKHFFDGSRHTTSLTMALELKPSLGDDYPAVLRQVLHQEVLYRVVVIDQFVAQGATLPQVRQIFQHSGIYVLTWAEISDAPNESLPEKPIWIPRNIDDIPAKGYRQ